MGSGFILPLLIYRESAKIWTSKMNLALMVLLYVEHICHPRGFLSLLYLESIHFCNVCKS